MACLCDGQRPGVARRASNFLSLARQESHQRKGDPAVCDPFAALRGNLGCSVTGCAVELALRCARRSDSHGESVHEARALRRACHPAPCAPQAHPEGNPRDIHAGHCFAALRSAPSRGRKRHALRKLGRAQRWPEWMLAVWMFGCPTPAGCACGGAVVGWHARRSARAS